MNHLKLIKGACCALMMMSSQHALAGWENVDSDVNITQSRAALDRVNRVYFTYVTVENTGTEAIDGPFRVLIDDATLPVVNAQGTTDAGVPFFDLDLSQLMPGESQQVRIDFELQRTRLSFTATLQNDVAGWEMVWNDEFDGTTIDSSKWSHEVNCDGGGNNEQQCYTDSAENSYVEDGILKIVAKTANGQPLPYSSARLRTVDKGDWTYGRFEIRAKAPSGQGSWPAIWMLPTDWEYGGWPHSGEIDIFESVNLGVPLNEGGVESNVHGTLHYGESWPNNDRSGHSYLLPGGENPADDFHTYAIEWEEGEMRWYVDGVLYQTQLKSEATYNTDGHADGLAHRGWYREDGGEYFYDNSPFDERFHMILNFAVGGDWPSNVNQGGIDESAFDGNNKFEIDYVRVYECSVNPTTGQGCATVTDGYLDPIDQGGTLNEGAAPTPVAPSDGIARDLIIFDDALNEAWPAWDCCGGTTPTIEYEDGEYLNVVEFVVGATPTVLGFNTNFADVPAPYDGSPMLDTGVLEFDLKLVTPPNNTSAGWNLKVEQGGTSSEVVIPLDTPTATWQHYTIPLKTLSNAGLNLNGIDVIMIFPDWGQGEGAVFRVDNVTILEGEVDDGGTESDLPALDFEPDGYGAALSWNVFENADNPAVEFVANPDTSGINGSSTVAKITARLAGAPWVGAETAHGDFGPMTIDASNSTIKVMVYKTVISDVGLKFAIPNGGAQGEIKVANTLVNQWEELTFDFSGYIGLTEAIGIDQLIFFPDFDLAGRSQENVVYFDNIRFFGEGDGDNGGDPDSGDELLTNGSFEDGTDSWIGAVEVRSDAGNQVFYANVASAGNPWDVNLSQVLTLLPGETYVLSFKAKTSGARSILAGLGLNHDPWTNLVEIVSLTSDWQSFSYVITPGFGDDNSRVLFDLGAETGEVFIDDVSLVIQSTDGGDEGDGESQSNVQALDFEAGGFGASLSWNVFENADNPAVEFVSNPDSSGINGSSTVAKIIARVDGAPWVGAETAHGDIGPFTLDATNSTIKIMVYKTVISDVGIKFAIANGGAQPEIKVANTLVNQWEELTFDFSGKIGLFETIDIDQIIVFPDFDLAGRTQENVVYFDNIRFFGEDGSESGGGDQGDEGDGGDSADEQVSNGSFENGIDGWNGGSIGTENGNSYFFADVVNAGNPWDVSLSQVMTLIPDRSYVLSFKAKASIPRGIIAGLGLNHDPWTAATESVGLSTTWQTFTYTLTTTGFGDDNSRVLFDMGAEIGSVFIDDVSVTLVGENGGGDGGDLPDTAPVLQNAPLLSADASEEYNYQMIVTDVNNDDISYAAVALPAFLTLSNSGLISGTPLESDIGQHEVSVTYSDGQFIQELIYTLFVSEAYLLEPPTPYVRTPVDANDPSTFNIINYGAGNIADGINPDGYDCVIDFGTWINSAGVTEPGVNGCDPIGDPTYRHPQVIGDIVNDPVPTHKWWGSIPFLGEMSIGNPNNAAYITPDPVVARISNKGVRVLGIPSGMRGDSGKFVYAIPDPFNEVFDGVAIANSAFDQLDAYLKNYSDGSVTVQWQSGNKPVMEATFVHGSPYIYFKAFRGQIVLKTKAVDSPEKGTFYQQGDSLGVWTSVAGNRNSYLMTGEGATTFENIASNAITVNNSSNEMTLTLLPTQGSEVPSAIMSDFFANLARNVVSKVDINYSVDRSDNSVTVSHRYLDQQGDAIETLAGMMPMAWKNSQQQLSNYKVRSARGMVRFSQTTEFDYEIPFVGVLPYLPSTIADFDEAYLVSLVNEYANQDPVQWNVNNDGNINYDTYWSGKSYGKMAEMAAIARSIGMNAQADVFIAWLKAELEDWFTADTNGTLDTEKYFVYDQEWSTVLGMKETFASHQQLNDHHFHYGYFVRAAAEVCRVDASWCGDDQFGPMIELLIRDYAADKGDDMFPYLRNFDPANGFSWASGNANFVLGNNNESTSEAANAYGAIALYGMITGNEALVEKGMYLHASSTSAYWEYWNNLDRYRNASADYPDRGNDYDNFPQSFDRLTTSIIWGTGSSFSTWFSGKYAHILGIQGLPLNPLVLHVGQHPDYMQEYVELGLTESTNGKPSGLGNDEWRDIWWNLMAMTDADAAFADYQTMDSNYAPENGESKAHTYHWVKTWQTLGHLKTGTGALTANHPAAVAFNNSGTITYIAYNYGASEITVTYSDGQQLVVAPEGFEIVVVEGDDSGD